MFNAEWLSMTQGVSFEAGTALITKIEEVRVATDTFTLVGVPEDGTVTVTYGTKTETGVEYSTGISTALTAIGAGDGDEVTVSYQVEITGEKMEFDAQKFSSKVAIEMRTIAYDIDTAAVYSDIYFIFPSCLGSGDFSMSFEAGSVITPEISFSVLQEPHTTVMGEMIEVVRT